MLGVTREAVRAICELSEPESVDGIRIHAGTRRFSRNGGSSIQIEAAGAPGVEDVVLEAEGARLFLDTETLRALDGKILDAHTTGDEPRFVVVREVEPARL